MLAGGKGTPEYDQIMRKLQEQNYSHQKEVADGKEEGAAGARPIEKKREDEVDRGD